MIGFGARKLYDDDQGPKYLNTPETPIYKKAQVLYGLDLAKRDISRSHRVVVVEGYTDVMACHLAGITTAIASCGTAFGSDHITVLRRVMGDDSSSGEVVFTFDPDAAGQKAALRAFADEKRFAAQTYVAVAPEGLDPCDLRLQRGDGAVRALMENKAPMFEFVIDQRLKDFDLSSVEGRAGALRAAAPIVADIRDPALRPGYVRVLARRLGLDMPEVQSAVERAARGADRAEKRETRKDSEPAPIAISVTMASLPNNRDVALERGAMMAFLQYGHRIEPDVFLRALQTPFSHPALEAVRSALASTDLSQPGWAVAAVEAVREPFRSLAAELLTAEFPARTEEGAVASANDLARGLLVRELEREKNELLRGIQRVPADSDEGKRLRFRLRELDADRQRLVAT